MFVHRQFSFLTENNKAFSPQNEEKLNCFQRHFLGEEKGVLISGPLMKFNLLAIVVLISQTLS